ncbi:MAG: hypothetical protein WEC59_04870 [Salibacteraceae bacterium]
MNEKRRITYTIVGLVLVVLVSYRLAFDRTLEAWDHHNDLLRQLVKLESENKEMELSHSLKLKTSESISEAQIKLLEKLEQSVNHNEVSLKRVSEPIINKGSGRRILTLSSELIGKFDEQVKTIHHLESSLDGLYVQSVTLTKQLNKKTKESELISAIWYKGILK